MPFSLEILLGCDPQRENIQRAETVQGAHGCLSSPGGRDSVAGLVNSWYFPQLKTFPPAQLPEDEIR